MFYIRITEIVIFLDFHSTRQVQPLVYSCSRGLDQNQMYPDRDTPGIVNRTQSNSIELDRTQSVDWVRLSSAIERNRTHRKEKNQSNPIERLICELVIYVKHTLKIHYQILQARVTSALSVAHVFKRRNSAEMASDALWIVSFKCIVKGYQECRFDVKDGEVFRVCSVLFS